MPQDHTGKAHKPKKNHPWRQANLKVYKWAERETIGKGNALNNYYIGGGKPQK